ncbi:MAG: hypothetical protein F4Z18_13130 [Caldilineaceae bacterium SB0666_bin_21]|nr:hypothetical protein [Caldilineaceae bacterium SB0666_bin_21]
MDFILTPADPAGQRALPDNPGACPQCGACAWRRNGTYARDLVVLGRLQVQRWQCKACLGSASPLPPGVTARQRPQAFRKLVTSMYVYSVSFRGLVRLLDLLGCGVGAATLWRDVQAVAPGRAPDPQAKLPSWVEVDETWLSLGGEKRPVAVVLGPKGARLDLRLSGSGFDWGGWFTDLAARGVQGLTTDDDPVYGPALETAGLDRQQCAVHMQRTVGRHIRGIDEDDLTHLDRVLLPILQRLARERPPEAGPVLLGLWEAVMQGRVRLRPEVRKLLWHLVERWHELVRSQENPKVPATTNRLEGWFGRFKPRARLTRGLKTEAGALNFVRLMARSMA